MKTKTDGPPVSVRFFEKPIARLYARLASERASLEATLSKKGAAE
jgi:hypothetical protein